MSTFREYKKNRPADPALVAQHKTEMQHQLNRERLAEIIRDAKEPSMNCSACDLATEETIADAIIQAGWTPPPTPQSTRPSQTIPYLDN